MKEIDAPLRCPCKGAYFSQRFSYLSPPEGEVRIRIDSPGAYRREVVHCSVCGHFVSNHDMDIHDLYRSDYVTSIYEDEIGIRRAFDRINSLDPPLSDNVGRVRRVIAFAKEYPAAAERDRRPPSVLDVGSGLCVFLYRMKSEGWDCTAVDPDPRSVQHARDTVGVKAVCGDFRSLQEQGRFDALTFNKVLEHVEDPVGMLSKSAENLYDGGFVYVEVPDGESAADEGSDREEFFIDHLNVFSSASLTLLASRSGFTVLRLERLREPSGKFTLCAFLISEKRGQAGGGFPRRDGSVPSPP